jgi:mRNA-degrading endonuclease RelE of RelBE toxin-antitoxin system
LTGGSPPEPYAVSFAAVAERELRKLRADDAARLRRPIFELAFDPRPGGSRVIVGSDDRRFRVGDLRVVYSVDDKNQRVIVKRIAKRAESTYRRL